MKEAIRLADTAKHRASPTRSIHASYNRRRSTDLLGRLYNLLRFIDYFFAGRFGLLSHRLRFVNDGAAHTLAFGGSLLANLFALSYGLLANLFAFSCGSLANLFRPGDTAPGLTNYCMPQVTPAMATMAFGHFRCRSLSLCVGILILLRRSTSRDRWVARRGQEEES